MAWPLPLYELALMTAGRAYDMGVDLEDDDRHPGGQPACDLRLGREQAVAGLLEQRDIETINSAYAEVPSSGEVVINPGDRHLQRRPGDRAARALRPRVRGIPLGEHGFIRVDRYGRVPDVEQRLRGRRRDRLPDQARAASAPSRPTWLRSRSRRSPGAR